MMLTQTERERCTHPERTMAPSGRYSTCTQCLLGYYKKIMKPVEHYKNRGHARFCFTKVVSEDAAGAIFVGLCFVAGLSVEVALEEDGMALRVYSVTDDAKVLARAMEWYAGREWYDVSKSPENKKRPARPSFVAVASATYNVPEYEVTSEMIDSARSAMFGFNYGRPDRSFNEALKKNPVKDEGKKETL